MVAVEAALEQSARRRRSRWLRIGCWIVGFLLFLGTVFFGLISWHEAREEKQMRAVWVLRDAGSSVQVYRETPSWLQPYEAKLSRTIVRLLSRRAFSVSWPNGSFGPKEIQALTDLHSVRGLFLPGVEASDELLATIGDLSSLRSLDLCGANMNDRKLEFLRGLGPFHELRLEGNPLTRQGFEVVRQLPQETPRPYFNYRVFLEAPPELIDVSHVYIDPKGDDTPPGQPLIEATCRMRADYALLGLYVSTDASSHLFGRSRLNSQYLEAGPSADGTYEFQSEKAMANLNRSQPLVVRLYAVIGDGRNEFLCQIASKKVPATEPEEK